MQTLLDLLSRYFDELLHAIDLWRLINDMAGLLALQLPSRSSVVAHFFTNAAISFSLVLDYFSFLDYFINLPYFLAMSSAILAIEAALAVPRVWRFIRSHIL